MSKKIEETIVIRSNKMIYAVRLSSKIEERGSREANSNPYLIVGDGKVKFIDRLYDSKSEFNFENEVHAIAKEIFVTTLRTSIKEQILQLKQLEMVLSEMGLAECMGDTLKDSAAFLQTIKGIWG